MEKKFSQKMRPASERGTVAQVTRGKAHSPERKGQDLGPKVVMKCVNESVGVALFQLVFQ